MTRLLIPRDRNLPHPEGEGIDGLPSACWTIDECMAHRCEAHTDIPILNEAATHDGFAECGACIHAKWTALREGVMRYLTTWKYEDEQRLRQLIEEKEK